MKSNRGWWCVALTGCVLMPAVRGAEESRPQVRINEILFDPTGPDAGSEWIELVNAGKTDVGLAGWTIAGRSGKPIATLPNWTLGSRGFLVVHFGQGQNDGNLGDGRGAFFTGVTAEVLSNSQDEVGLYAAVPLADSIVDFVAYAFDEDYRPGAAHQHAVAAKTWPAGVAFMRGEFVQEGNTIGRNASASDTDGPDDWCGDGGVHGHGPSPGAPNKHRLSFDARATVEPAAVLLALGELTDAQQAAANQMLFDVLKQIREKHMNLIEPTGDPGLGTDEPRVEESGNKEGAEKGDVVVGQVRFRFRQQAQVKKEGASDGTDVAGEAHLPDNPKGEILIELSLSTLTDDGKSPLSKWLMKDLVLHELVHAAYYRDVETGYWRQTESGSKPTSERKQKDANHANEIAAYVSNLALLRRLLKEFPDPKDQEGIRTRYQAKIKKIVNEYWPKAASVVDDYKGVEEGIGDHVREILRERGEELLRHKVYGYLLQFGKLGKAQLAELRREQKQLNNLKSKQKPLTDKDLEHIIQEETQKFQEDQGGTPGETPKPPDEKPTPSPEEKKRQDDLKKEHRKLVEEVERLDEVVKEFEKYQKSGNAGQDMVDQAKKKREEAEKKLEEFENQHEEELKKLKIKRVTSLGGTTPSQSATLLKSPARVFQTSEGMQAYAALEQFARTGDLAGAIDWGRQVAAHRESLAGTNAPAQQLQELQLVEAAARLIDQAVQELVSRVRELGDALKKQPGGSQALMELLRKQPPGAGSTLPPMLGPHVHPGELLGRILDLFAPEIFRQATSTPTATPGAAVVKGNAVLQTPTQPPAVVSVKITFTEPTPETPSGTEPKTAVTKTDPAGQFQVELPPGAVVQRVQLSGENVHESSSTSQSDASLRFQLGWPREAWDQLTIEQRAPLLSASRLWYDGLREHVTGSIFLPRWVEPGQEEQVSEIFDEATPRQTALGLYAAERLLGSSQSAQTWLSDLGTQKALQQLAEENLRRALEQEAAARTPETQSLLQTLRTEARRRLAETRDPLAAITSIAPMWDLSRVSAPPKPEQIVTETPGAMGDDQARRLSEQLRQLVLKNVGAEQTVTVAPPQTQFLALPPAAGGQSTVTTWEFQVRSPDGAPVKPSPDALQQSLNDLASANPDTIRFAEAAQPRTAEVAPPNDPHFAARGTWGQDYQDQWALRRIGFADAETAWWDRIARGTPCTVAVIGSGVDWTHPELLGQMWVNAAEDPYNGRDDDGNGYIDDQFGWNFRDNSNDVMDYGGHDTHVAGVIAARWNNGRGLIGVNPLARIMALKTANSLGQSNSVDIGRAILYAVDHGARVINISYSGASPSRFEQRAIDYALARGVLVVTAAGNQAADAQPRGLAGSRGAFTVAGTATTDSRAPFSNWGQPIALSAPSMDVLSLRARGTDFLLYVGENPNYVSETGIVGKQRDLYRASGTSFAAPFVSGTASLILSQRPNLTARQVQNILLMSADDLDVPGWDQNTGAGLLNARKALQADPDHYLVVRISQVRPVRREGQVLIEISGQAEGSSLTGRWLQFAFGPDPAEDAWETVGYQNQPLAGGVLGTFPTSRMNRRGTWSIRLLVQDDRKTVRQARATLEVQ